MKKKHYSFLLLGILGFLALAGCNSESVTPVETSFQDITKDSIYGQLSNFQVNGADVTGANVKPGDVMTFTVTPSKYFKIDEITNNGAKCTKVSGNDPLKPQVWSTTIVEGTNRLKGSYVVDETIDFVDEFKLEISDAVFNEVISKQKQTAGVRTDLDFRRCGIEQVGAPLKFKENSTTEKEDSGYFVNYVDGDTTHVETLNLGYTVKIRYLSIDTPESTSEIEEWGLSASNYSKFIYSGDLDYKKTLDSTTDFTGVQYGVTSLILIGQDVAMHGSELTLEDLKLGSTEEGTYPATTDGNQRSLAYVWYATKANPTKNDFRCLNLEMVYQGFSFGVGSRSDTSDYIYRMFDAAHLSAQANHRHIFSGLEDPNYYDYEKKTVQNLTLEALYKSAKLDSDIGYYPTSPYCNKKTLYRVEGYVSRKLATAFYIQDKTSYTAEEVAAGKCYGLYVFTYSETPIVAGDYVSVIGAISSYGGTFQMQGISYHDLSFNENRDTKIISSGHVIEPVKLTGAQFNAKKLPQVLVEITDSLWFYDFTSTYQGETESIGEGGSEEINKYNEAYPFYNTSNSPIIYASFGDVDNAESINTSSKNIRYDNNIIRFTVDQDILVTCGIETCYSYRFFCGGSYMYNPKGAEYANEEETNEYKDLTVTRTFDRKTAKGMIVMSVGYESTGGNKKMTAKICSGLDVELTPLTA